MAALVVGVLAVVVGAAVYLTRGPGPEPSPPVAVAEGDASDPKVEALKPAVIVSKPSEVLHASDVEAGVAEAEARRKVERLLTEAKVLFAADQLLTPPENSAFGKYREVLLLEPGNREAEAGLQAIVERYDGWGDVAMRRGRYEEAETYYRRGLTVDPSSSALRGKLTAARKAAQALAEETKKRKETAATEKKEEEQEREAARVARVAGSLVKGARDVEMVWIPAGSFTMGSPTNEPGRDINEDPHRRVTLSNGFWMGRYEVTVGEFRGFVESTGYRTEAEREGGVYTWTGEKWEMRSGVDWRRPGFGQSDRNPVTCVSWNDAVRFCNWLSEQEGLRPAYRISGNDVTWDRGASGYRSPTEAEWEYAARAGTETAVYTGPLRIVGECNDPALDAIAWYCGNSGVGRTEGMDCSNWAERQYSTSRCGTHPVGRKQPNAWGLYDMIGNVWEWCWDWNGLYSSGAVTDPTGPSSGVSRVTRGGGWINNVRACRSAVRLHNPPGNRNFFLGFRLARSGP